MKNDSTWSTSFSNLKNGGKDVMKDVERNELTKIEKEGKVGIKYTKLLIKICKDLSIKNYKEIIKNYITNKN